MNIRFGANVRMQRVGDEAVLLDTDRGLYYSLNETAVLLLESLLSGSDQAMAIDCIVERFDITADEAAADLARLLDALHAQGLIETQVSQ